MQQELFDVQPYTPSRSYRIPIYKIALVREASLKLSHPPQVRSSEQAASVIRSYLAGTDREHLLALTLDTKNRLIGINTVSVGTLTSSLAHPREVFKAAILQNAAAVVLAHNHPSGDPTPSQEDRMLTNRIKQAAEFLGIRLLDHIIVGDGCERFFSFLDEGLL